MSVHTGDALEWLASLPAGSADAIVTDPPYGMAYQSMRSKDGPRFDAIVGDEKPAVEFIGEAMRVLRDGGAVFVFCEWRHQEAFRAAIERSGATVRSQCIWDREVHGMGDLQRAFAPCHDVAWFATKGDAFSFYGPRPQSVLRFQRVAAKSLCHPAEKPVRLMRHLVSRLAPVGGVVVDPYAGSGTTGVAAVMEGRRFMLCEMVPAYADLARRRVAAAIGTTDYRSPHQAGLFQ